MKTDAFGSCPRLISDRVSVTLPAALAEEAATIAGAVLGRPVRPKTAPEGARFHVPLDPKARDRDTLVGRLVAAFEDLEGRNAGVSVSLERERVGGELPPIEAGTFDLIVANITADVLQRLAGDFVSRLAAGGALVLSGMLADLQSDEIGAVYEALGCRRAAARLEGEWEALLFIR